MKVTPIMLMVFILGALIGSIAGYKYFSDNVFYHVNKQIDLKITILKEEMKRDLGDLGWEEIDFSVEESDIILAKEMSDKENINSDDLAVDNTTVSNGKIR